MKRNTKKEDEEISSESEEDVPKKKLGMTSMVSPFSDDILKGKNRKQKKLIGLESLFFVCL